MPLPIIAIVGRPNVGKSSLFNRIVGWRQAIVSEIAGTTRDRLMAQTDWEGRPFILLDTGGLDPDPAGSIQSGVQEQAQMAMNDADAIILLTDVADGLTPADLAAAQRLRTSPKPIILAVNKVDNDNRELNAPEFWQLGIGQPIPISAYHNYGIHELMEQTLAHLPPYPAEDTPILINEGFQTPPTPTEEGFQTLPPPKGEGWGGGELPAGDTPPIPPTPDADAPPTPDLNLAIIGRTNVGKSALLNAILGQQRTIVSPTAGTTRDAIDTQFTYRGRPITLIDTAGIRRRGQVLPGIEKYSVIRAIGAVDRCDIALMVVDASELATAQDAHIAGLSWEMGRGIIVVINKWDLRDDQSRYARADADAEMRQRLHFMSYIPICFTSALHRQGIGALMDTVMELWNERRRLVGSRDLQLLLADALSEHNPPLVKRNRGRRARINRIRQVGINPPTFLFTVNDPKLIHYTYKRYLENRIREAFAFDRTHLRLVFRPE